MRKVFPFFVIFGAAVLLLWAFPFFSVALSAPTQNVDLVTGKSNSPDPAIAGNALIYTLAVTNSGDLQATGVVVTDTLPSQVSFTAASPGCHFEAGRVLCNVGNLDIGESATRSVTVQVDPSARGSITNIASSSSHEPDLIPSTNTAQVTTNINASAELGISKSDGITRIIAGDGVVYSYAIIVTNGGPSLAGGVVVTDMWPIGFTRLDVVPSQGTCDELTSPTNFTCDLGDILAGGQETIIATYNVPLGTSEGLYTNTAEANSPDAPALVTATDANTVLEPVDLGISKSDGVSQVTAGNSVTYHYGITVTNESPSLASGVVVTDTWPAGFTRMDVVPSQGTCDEVTSPTNFTCDLGDILAGGEETIIATYNVPPGTPAGIRTNTAEADALNANTPVTASDVNTVVTSANLGINKTDGTSQIIAGNGVTYHYDIVVTNNGPSVASGVVVTDTWPVGFTRLDVVPSQGTCDELTSPTNFTCALGNILAGGGQQSIVVTYNVPSGTPAGSYTNISVGDALNAGAPVTENDTTNVITRANLGILKLDDPDPVNAGETLTYTLTVNNAGPSDAVGVVISDTLPLGTTFNDALSSATCDAAGRIVTCNLGGMANAGSTQVVIRADVALSAEGTITNRARVTATTLDLISGNNLATASTTVDVGHPVVTWELPVTNDQTYYYIDCLPHCPIVHFSVRATDDLGVQRVDFYRWDHVRDQYLPIGSDTTASPPDIYTWDFNTSVLPVGYNQIFAKAFDSIGNESLRKRIFLVKREYNFLPVVNQ